MKLFATLGLTFLLSMSGAQAQGPVKSLSPTEKPRTIKIALQQDGKTFAVIDCRGDVTFESLCRFDVASSTFIFAMSDGEIEAEGDGCIYDSKTGISIFPGKVSIRTKSREKTEKNIFTAQDATLQFPPVAP
jgi:hypothetical protein